MVSMLFISIHQVFAKAHNYKFLGGCCMKKIALLVLILSCIIFVLTGCYIEETPQKVNNTTGTTNQPTQSKTEIYKIGDSVKLEIWYSP